MGSFDAERYLRSRGEQLLIRGDPGDIGRACCPRPKEPSPVVQSALATSRYAREI